MKMPEHLPRWLKILTFHENESRKVAFGIWLFIVATRLLEQHLVGEVTWCKCAFVSGALIGFGPMLDKLIDKYFDKWSGTNGPPSIPPVV